MKPDVKTARILGIDPGLQKTGWGIIESNGNALSYIASGTIKSAAHDPLPQRLATLDKALSDVIHGYSVDAAAVEETFMNNNAASALKLGQARGVALVCPARYGLPVFEYAATKIKKSLTGTGHASKTQIAAMIRHLLPTAPKMLGPDAADALAIAICHTHFNAFLAKTAIAEQG